MFNSISNFNSNKNNYNDSINNTIGQQSLTSIENDNTQVTPSISSSMMASYLNRFSNMPNPAVIKSIDRSSLFISKRIRLRFSNYELINNSTF